MKKVLLTTIAFALLMLSFSSCGDDDDPTKPVIENLIPTEGQSLQIGKTIHFEVDLSDEVGLRKYLINIHNNFDGHGNHKSAGSEIPEGTQPFEFNGSWMTDDTGESLEGQKKVHIKHFEITIPETVKGEPTSPGKYHFLLQVINKDGRQTVASRNIELTNEEIGE